MVDNGGGMPARGRHVIVIVIVTLGSALWLATMVVARIEGVPAIIHFVEFSRYLAAETFIAAGLLHALCWRTSRSPGMLRLAIALVATGFTLPILDSIAPWSVGDPELNSVAAAVRTTLLCVILAAGIAARGERVFPTTAAWTATALAAIAIGDSVWLLSVWRPQQFLGLASAFSLAAGVLLIAAGTADLRATWQRQRGVSATLSRELDSTFQLLERAGALQRERLHDARSAVAGVIGASELLARTVGEPAGEHTRLKELIAAELTRLQHLLGAAEPLQEFDVLDVIRPVVLAHRLECPQRNTALEAAVEPLRAVGHPHATGTALANVLRNVRVHAPGAGVLVTVRRVADMVQIDVADDGPGIPRELWHAVLRRGVRRAGPDVPGEGIGLASAAAAMARQGGSLRLDDSSSGGVRVTLLVPAALRPVHAIAC